MSLWRHRAQIERAVAGQLSGDDEQKLRAHLSGCAECRRHYDALTVQARILAGDPHESQSANARELARLMTALAPAAAPKPSPLRWLVPAGVLALAAIAVVFVPRGEEVSFRGAPDGKKFSFFVVTAPMDGGELTRDISFPGPAGTVHADHWVTVAVNQSPDPKPSVLSGVFVSETTGETVTVQSGKTVALSPGKWTVRGVGEDAGTLASGVITVVP